MLTVADLTDVLNTLSSLVATAVYPNGILQPSVAGVEVTVCPGWPVRTVLDDQLLLGHAMVSIFPTNQERIVTKFERAFQPLSQTPATLTLTILNNTVTIGGTVTVPQAVSFIVNYVGYAYQVLITDTLTTIAAGIAALIPGATSVGPVVTITGVFSLDARVATPYSAIEELNRQERVLMITCWCTTPTIRTALGSAIRVYLDQQYRIPMTDGIYANMWYSHTNEIDMLEKSLVYRRDLNYKIQYATSATETTTTITDSYLNSLEITNET